jgi:RNA polymerase sigma factor (sigma-70 family)
MNAARDRIQEEFRRVRARLVMLMSTTDSDSSANATRPSLLLRLRDPRDADAWCIFVETYTPLVYAYCRRRGLQASDVADVTQEVMAQVLRSIPDFMYQPERGRFRDWLGTITRTKLLRFLARNARAGKGGEAGAEEATSLVEAPESDTLWTEGFHARVLEVAMNRARPDFKEATWTLFERAWLMGQTAPDVARELGVPIESVYIAKSRVLKRLRSEVVMLAEDYPPLLA